MKAYFKLPFSFSYLDLIACPGNEQYRMITLASLKNEDVIKELGEWFAASLGRVPKVEYIFNKTFVDEEIHCCLKFDLKPDELTLFNLRWN